MAYENIKASAQTNTNKSANVYTTVNLSIKAKKQQKCMELQLECKHVLELAEIIQTLYCNHFVDSIVDCTTSPAKIQVNPVHNILWINANNSRELNIYMYY